MSKPPPAPDLLRRRAEQALPPRAPEPLGAALRHARLRLEPDVERWDASTGRVRAHRLGFGTDAATLGRLRRSPSLAELLCEAFAAAFALDEGHSLFDLRYHWALAPAPVALGPYRGSRWPDARLDDETAVREAALAYLEALGDDASRRWLDAARLTLRPAADEARVSAEGPGAVDGSAIERALADLLEGFERRRVIVRVRSHR